MMKMRIALIGYGKMGKEVERVASTMEIEIASIIDPGIQSGGIRFNEISSESLKNADVAIDFTTPGAAVENIRKTAGLGKDMVMATTGWHEQLEEARKIMRSSKTGLIFSSNFSIGVNLYLRIIGEAAKLVDRVDSYDAFGYELHHSQKVDSPSGTAKAIAEMLLKSIKRKTKAVYDRIDRKIGPEELHFASIRAGSIPGTHVVGFDSDADTIELRHTARNRSGFAAGVLMAAEWIQGRKGLFTMSDFMDDYFKAR